MKIVKKLQLALDFLEMAPALKVTEAVLDYVDLIEAGTPLIKSVGMESVRRLRDGFPGKEIVADMKTADVGAIEVEMAARAGADYVSVMAAGPRETVVEAAKKAKELGVKLMVDTIGAREVASRVREFDGWGDYLLIHCGIDEQARGLNPMSQINKVAGKCGYKLAVAGGIDADRAAELARIPEVEIVIVGGAICGFSNPGEQALEIKKALMNHG